MLNELKIENFALVQDLEIRFQQGFNVITGESGAGKSLIVEALNFVLGGRIKSGRITGDQPARVQAVFAVSSLDGEILSGLKESGIIDENDDNLILTRKIYSNGRNVYHINGEMIPLKFYQSVGQSLVDIHGQRDSLFLLEAATQRSLLDDVAGEPAKKILNRLSDYHRDFREISGEIDKLKEMERERNRQIDWINFEISEIESAGVQPGEDEELEKTKSILSNAEKISNLAADIYETLSGDRGVIDQINRTSRDLSRWAGYDPEMEHYKDVLEAALEEIQEISFVCRERGESIEFSQERLDSIISRIHQIEGLKRKYGGSITDILEYLNESRKKLALLEGSAGKINDLEEQKDTVRREWLEYASELSNIRKKYAVILQNEVMKELSDLGFENAIFRIDISALEGESDKGTEKESFSITPYGLDRVEYMFGPNPGTPEQPLALIASGGEISRVMLALKNIFARFRNFSTLVLDEIDMGMGGSTAEAVARKLGEISQHRQIICITHLPVIAAMADVHYHIQKTVEEGATRTNLIQISGEDRIDEMIRMIAGENAPAQTRQVVKKMLKGKR